MSCLKGNNECRDIWQKFHLDIDDQLFNKNRAYQRSPEPARYRKKLYGLSMELNQYMTKFLRLFSLEEIQLIILVML